jgi:pSer/pThr/pTyr-binding forkhead associated (FHA) protein
MDRIILTLTSELFDDTVQEVSVRPNLTIQALIAEVQREFNLPDSNYALTLKGSPKPLEPRRTMEELSIQTGAELIFGREQRRLSQQIVMRGGNFFQVITTARQASLRESSTNAVFTIDHQPALIGRSDHSNPASADILTADLSHCAEARTVSRQHARITEQGGLYYLESVAERNPTFLNDHQLVSGEKRALKDGDTIRVGKILLTFGY